MNLTPKHECLATVGRLAALAAEYLDVLGQAPVTDYDVCWDRINGVMTACVHLVEKWLTRAKLAKAKEGT